MPSPKDVNRASELHLTLAEPRKTKAFHKRYGRYIAVNRKVYELVVCTSLFIDGQDCAGACVAEEKRLYINISSSSPVEEILLHEIVHAEIGEAGYRQRIDWDPNLEEPLCELVGRALSHTYKLQIRRKIT